MLRATGRFTLRVCWRRMLRLAAVALLALAALFRPILWVMQGYNYLDTWDTRRDVATPPGAENVRFRNARGEWLSGWFFHVPSGGRHPAIIVVPPSGRTGWEAAFAARLGQAEFHVLSFDLRSFGRSDGSLWTIGVLERHDVAAAAAYLRSRPDVDGERQGIWGVSFGAGVALLGTPAVPQIRALALDSTPSDIYADLGGDARLAAARWLAWLRYGVDLRQARPLDSAPHLGPRALLLLVGAEDTRTPPEQSRAIYEAAQGSPRELHVAPGATHARYEEIAREDYWLRVREWFVRYV